MDRIWSSSENPPVWRQESFHNSSFPQFRSMQSHVVHMCMRLFWIVWIVCDSCNTVSFSTSDWKPSKYSLVLESAVTFVYFGCGVVVFGGTFFHPSTQSQLPNYPSRKKQQDEATVCPISTWRRLGHRHRSIYSAHLHSSLWLDVTLITYQW